MCFYKFHNRFDLISLTNAGQFIQTFGDIPLRLITFTIPGLGLLIRLSIYFLVEFGYVVVESIYTLHSLLVFLLHLLQFLQKTFLPSYRLFIFLHHLYNFAFCLDQLLMFSQFLFPKLLILLQDFLQLLLKSLYEFLILSDILILFDILQ